MDIIIFFSKYLILLFMGLLVISSIITILQEYEVISVNLKNPSLVLTILFHILCSFILVINNDLSFNIGAFIYCVLVLAFIIVFKIILYFLYRDSDFLISNIMIFMLDLSFIFLYRLNQTNAIKQLTFASVGVVAALIIPFLFNLYSKGFEKFKHFDYIFIIFIFGFLCLPFLFGINTYGANNWVYIKLDSGAIFTFQPSEIVKVLFIFYLASSFSRAKSFKNLVLPTIVSFLSILILASQNDFGGCLMYFTIYIVLLYITTSSVVLLALGVSAVAIVATIAYKFVYHIKVRVDIFLDPFQSPYGDGQQILQSLFAIGTEAPFGSGLTKGYPKYVPVVDSDFIFAGICEEFGALFGLFLIVLILIFVIRALKVAMEANQKHLILIAIGIAISLGVQSFLIIGGNIKLIPLTGVTLPLISYGGTSVLISIVMIMILLRIDLINLEDVSIYNPFKFIRKNVKFALGFIAIIYICLFGYLFKFVFFQSSTIVSSIYNPRVSVIESENIRGNIFDRNMNLLVESSEDNSRIYNYGRIFAHTIGSVQSGKTGLELSYNFRMQNPNNELAQMINSIIFKEKIYGNSIVTTLDKDLQQFSYEQLKGKKGSIIVSEAKTGKILTMVSYSDFSPRTYGEDFGALSKDSENTPLINRATQGLYPPASTFKILSSLNIIRNMENYKDYIFLCTGSVNIDGEIISCNNGEVHGEVNLEDAFRVSCNSYFAQTTSSLDLKNYINMMDSFNFNKSVDFDIPLSTSYFRLTTDSNMGEIMQTAIGQGNTLATPLELNMITQSVANKGIMVNPSLVSSVVNENNKTVKEFSNQESTRVMTEEEALEIGAYMKAVVENGTAIKAKPYNVTLAGKTGTAEVTDKKSHGLFVGYAPYEDPEIVITVVLENSGGSGSTLPIVKNIVEYYFNK